MKRTQVCKKKPSQNLQNDALCAPWGVTTLSRFPCPDAAQNTLSSSHGAAIGFALAKEVEVSLSSGSSFKDVSLVGCVPSFP